MSVAGERKFTGILHDLSVRVRIEQELREKTGLAMLGEMAAVIAHEVKNPLAGVRGAIQVIGSRLPEGTKDALIVKEILGRIDALNELMKDLLLFARPPQPRLTPVDLEQLVELTAGLVRQDPVLKDFHIEIEGSACPIHADAEMLKIVFLNLIVNGAHAMEEEQAPCAYRSPLRARTAKSCLPTPDRASRRTSVTRSSRRSSRPRAAARSRPPDREAHRRGAPGDDQGDVSGERRHHDRHRPAVASRVAAFSPSCGRCSSSATATRSAAHGVTSRWSRRTRGRR